MKQLIYTFIFILIGLNLYGQQEMMSTQFMFNKMSINPAFAGHEKYTGLTMMIRDQWNGIPGAPKTQMLSVNLPRKNQGKIGLGFNLKSRQIGVFKDNTISGIYSYKFLFGDNGLLSMGLELSGRTRLSDFTNPDLIVTQGIALDPSIPKTKLNNNSLNVGYGLYFTTNKFYLGASVPRLIENDLDFDQNNFVSEEVRHLFVMSGTSFKVKKDLIITTQGLMKFAKSVPFDFDFNVSAIVEDKYTGGITYRAGGASGDIGESLDVIFAFQISDKFMVGFSNDFTLSQLRKYDNGSIELVVNYALGKKKNKVVVVNPRYF
jgi:type IX secretion system PorP/SprF family membrane protein